MKRRLAPLPGLLGLVLFASLAFGLGADHPSPPDKHPVSGTDAWPKGLADLANDSHRVHGYFVNSEDVFSYQGNTRSLNAFLEAYAQLKGTELEVVLHPGKEYARSPWDKKPRDVLTDWKLYASPCPWDGKQLQPFITRVDVWLGGTITLADLAMPANVPVRSGGEIEQFVKAHEARVEAALTKPPVKPKASDLPGQPANK